eukprot:12056161-Alexandrium_andersonii.AAC.1
MEEHFMSKVEGKLGGGPQDLQEVRLLNRIIRWTKEGLRYQADLRHAEQLLRDLLAPGKGAKQESFP